MYASKQWEQRSLTNVHSQIMMEDFNQPMQANKSNNGHRGIQPISGQTTPRKRVEPMKIKVKLLSNSEKKDKVFQPGIHQRRMQTKQPKELMDFIYSSTLFVIIVILYFSVTCLGVSMFFGVFFKQCKIASTDLSIQEFKENLFSNRVQTCILLIREITIFPQRALDFSVTDCTDQ